CSSTGGFDVSLGEAYGGWVLLRARGAAGSYQSAVTGQPVSLGATGQLLGLLHYEPTAEGAFYADVQVNAATTLATSLAVELAKQGMEQDAAVEMAFGLVGEHLNRFEPLAVGLVRAADMRGDATFESDAAQRLGLFHVG